MSDKTRVRIESGGTGSARIFINDVDVSNTVTAVTWSMQAGESAVAHVEFRNVQIDAQADLAAAYTAIRIDPAALAKCTTGEGFEDIAAQHPLG